MVCYRHPDRNAGVACQRCDRPICPSCMITASVGFQCPECVKGSPQAQTAKVLRRAAAPYVSYALLGINVAAYFISRAPSLLGGSEGGRFSSSAVGGDLLTRLATEPAGVADGEWWRLVSGGFLHANLVHLAFNMFALYQLGPAMEHLLGRTRFIAAYVACLLGGSAGVMLLAGPCDITVGASGAIFGLFGLLVLWQLSQGVNPLQNSLGMVLLLNLALTFGIPGISIGGHVGGLATGLGCGVVLFGTKASPVPRHDASSNARLAVVCGLAVVLAVAGVAIAGARAGAYTCAI